MMELLQRARDIFCFCGVSEKEYNKLKKDAYQANFVVWKYLHLLMLVLFTVMTIYGYIAVDEKVARFLYLILMCYSALSVVMFFFVLNPEGITAQLWIYLSMSVLLCCGLRLALDQPDMMSVTFVVLLVALSVFMIDKPYFMTTLMVIAVAIYSCHITVYKSAAVIRYDVINAVIYAVVAIVINTFYNCLRIKEFQMKHQIEEQRDTDELTGLRSKRALVREINACITGDAPGVMMILDIDHFKEINDNYGHDIGDRILHEIGTYMSGLFEEGDIAGRFGGDEFIVYLPGQKTTRKAEVYSEGIIRYMNEKIHTPNYNEVVGICVGIAIKDTNDRNYDTLFKKSDIALYEAKKSGRNRLAIYGKELQ